MDLHPASGLFSVFRRHKKGGDRLQLFKENKPFFKGNLHCHTTLSDGVLSPEKVTALYRDMGYDFLAITDHRKLSPPTHTEDGLLLLTGVELDYTLSGEVLHLLGIGMRPEYADALPNFRRSPQHAIDDIRTHGGMAIVAHPAWSLNTLATLSSLQGVTAAEIYNSISTFPWNGDRADSSGILDVCLAHQTPFRFVASDDSHFYNGEAGRSYTMVQADELNDQAILAALAAGRSYASQGPRFEQLSIENGILTVQCSPVETIIFYSNLVWVDQRCRTAPGQTSASYDLTADSGETFVRCQIIDAGGNSAWSNPILCENFRKGAF